MRVEIKEIGEKKLVGKRLKMSLAENQTAMLWKSFMPFRTEIKKALSEDLIDMRIYEQPFDPENFDAHASFDKWAAKEVSDFSEVPQGMETYLLRGGLYAVFYYKGASDARPGPFAYIFGTWLPASGYQLDNREYFEVLGEKYKKSDTQSEEEIWIPVKE